MTSIVGTVNKAMVYKLQIVTGMMSSFKVQNSEKEEEEKGKVEQEANRMERRRSDKNDNIQCWSLRQKRTERNVIEWK